LASCFAVLAAALFASTSASAQEKDGARFRGGIALEGGAIIIPSGYTVGLGGVQGQLGVQVNNMVGIYAVPNLDIVFGQVGGVNIGSALLVDFTFDKITVGAGPDVSAFAAIGGGNGSVSAAGGALYGGRLHLAFHPALSTGEDGIRRKAFSIGLDMRLLAGAAGSASTNGVTTEASATNFVLSPMLTLGYSAF
jgi:hypothetical protein